VGNFLDFAPAKNAVHGDELFLDCGIPVVGAVKFRPDSTARERAAPCNSESPIGGLTPSIKGVLQRCSSFFRGFGFLSGSPFTLVISLSSEIFLAAAPRERCVRTPFTIAVGIAASTGNNGEHARLRFGSGLSGSCFHLHAFMFDDARPSKQPLGLCPQLIFRKLGGTGPHNNEPQSNERTRRQTSGCLRK